MPRPFTDIKKSIDNSPIKNGSSVLSTPPTGMYQTLNTSTQNTPELADISAKYGYRFHNGIFVELIDGQTVIGG